MQVIGSYAANLLEWLDSYTFVEEQRFGDEAHAARIASKFFDELIRHGTTTAGRLLLGASAIGRCVFRRGRQTATC